MSLEIEPVENGSIVTADVSEGNYSFKVGDKKIWVYQAAKDKTTNATDLGAVIVEAQNWIIKTVAICKKQSREREEAHDRRAEEIAAKKAAEAKS